MNICPNSLICNHAVDFFRGTFLETISSLLKKIGIAAALAFGMLVVCMAACIFAKGYFFKVISLAKNAAAQRVDSCIEKGDIIQLVNCLERDGKQIRKLNLEKFPSLDDQKLQKIAALVPNLENLRLDCSNITQTGFVYLTDLAFLKNVKLKYCSLFHYEALSKLVNLEHLEISNTEMNDPMLEQLKPLVHLKTLVLKNEYSISRKITDKSLEHLKNLAALEHLTINYGSEITDDGIKQLSSLNLKTLSIGGSPALTDESLKNLKTHQFLTTLILLTSPHLTDQGLEELKSFKFLENLSISSTLISDKGLQHISAITSLKSLMLLCCSKITDQGLTCLATLTDLKDLHLSGCKKITSKGLKDLQSLKQLEKLELADCQNVDDKGLKLLKAFSKLKYLDVQACYFSLSALEKFKKRFKGILRT